MIPDNQIIFTFYSYKGGVGRSMALANIAELLYRQGKRVVVVDWDLEAPGLEGYFYSSKKELDHITAQPGLIDMLESYKSIYPRLSNGAANGSDIIDNSTSTINNSIQTLLNREVYSPENKIQPEHVTTLLKKEQEYIIRDEHIEKITIELNKYFSRQSFESYVIFDSLQAMLKKTTDDPDAGMRLLTENLPAIAPLLHPIRKSLDENSKAGLWLLSAGRRNGQYFSTYAKTVQDFDWSEFYEVYDGKNYFNWLRKELKNFADIVLIDSRTGVTEMGGVCTRHLSDIVILLTPPNAQNVSGISEMVKSIKRPEVEEARGRSVDMIVIPSRIDNSELRDLNNFHSEFLSQIGDITGESVARQFWELSIPYVPYYTYHEELVAGASMLNPDTLKDSKKSAHLEKAYLRIASFMLNARFEPLPEKAAVNPYIGLRPFEETDSVFFYGRNVEISRIIEIVTHKGMIVVAGPTGSGKTSILRAGVIPAIKASVYGEKPHVVMLQPGANFLYNLTAALLQDEGNRPLHLDGIPPALAELVQNDNQSNELLQSFAASGDYTQKYSANGYGKHALLLIIDQFEELFSSEEKTITSLIKVLIDWRRINPAFGVILSIRSEYQQELTTLISEAQEGEPAIINLGVLSKNELRQSMIEPAAKAGLNFEEGLVERILKDSEKMFLKLPLIQNVLHQLWTKRAGNTLLHQTYDELGQMEGIMQDFISKNVSSISKSDLEIARPIITRLIDVQTYRSKPIKLTDLDKEDFVKLKPLINAGLIAVTFNNQKKTENIEFASEGFITELPFLKEWVRQDLEFLKWRQVLNMELETRRANNQGIEGYWPDHALFANAEKWLERYPDALSKKEKDFIHALTNAAEERAHKTKREAKKFAIRTAAIVLGVGITACILTIVLVDYYKSHQNLKQFRQALNELRTKSGTEKQSALCDLAKFNNTSESVFIQQSKDSLLALCLNNNLAINETQAVIDSTDSKIQNLSTTVAKSQISISKSEQIDRLDLQLNKIKGMIINSADDPVRVQRLQGDSFEIAGNIDNIIKTDTLLQKARKESNKLEESILTQQLVISKNNDAVFQQSSWFKKNYFLQFENIKILLLNLSKSNQSISIEICDMIGPTRCKDPLATAEITLSKPFSLTYGDFTYTIQLDRIGGAGNNPFTYAAYITFAKYKNQ